MFNLIRIALAALLAAVCSLSYAADWPSRPVTLIVPFTSATGIDLIARRLSAELPKKLGQPFVVENLAGASGNIGTEKAARARPDGYTFLVTVSTLVMNRTLYKLPYDPVKDFAPVGQTSWGTLVLVTGPSNPVHSVAGLVAAAKAEPGKLTYGSPGVGTPHHLAMALLDGLTGIRMLHVPYKGTAGAVQDMLGGRLDYMFLPIHVALPQIKAGKLKAIAVGSPNRVAQLPEIPTLGEAGLKGANVDMWYGVLAPKGTPAAIIEKMNKAVNEVLASPATAVAFESQGMVPAASTPDQFGALIVKDDARWAEVIKDAKITAN
ncbi:tripartite tricarboxylate transporter substrate binding protein [Paralcaligenes ureilyticus]|uniref:Tripartite-type tricarboxylate transporter receptor subunit TctC n=1 Tax=Paralcaligenes ureilyticus TaxID=627131 RepID=A0A4R3LMY5_9BURK|nr:tripartite tricarboxylate transporter substrate binding protein [Paralcaligenes ureilyticus]TCT01770.1 tripartite-type tricarboxylate transporter receptor subunit TctC [Paralcaligenes ureilyticus]